MKLKAPVIFATVSAFLMLAYANCSPVNDGAGACSSQNCQSTNPSISDADHEKQTVEFESSSTQSQEGATLSIRLSRNRSDSNLTVPIAIDGSVEQSGNVSAPVLTYAVFAEGMTATVVQIRIGSDFVAESNETINLRLLEGSSYALGLKSVHSVHLAQSFAQPSVSLSQATLALVEGASGAFQITRAGGDLSQPLRVRLQKVASLSDQANLSDHFTLPVAESGGVFEFEIPANRSSLAVNVACKEDATSESASHSTLRLVSSPTYSNGSVSEINLTEVENDKPVVTFSAAEYAGNEGATVTLRFTRSSVGLAGALEVPLHFDNPSAAAAELAALPDRVVFAAGAAIADVPVQIKQDSTTEATERFAVRLVKTDAFMLGAVPGANIKINGDAPLTMTFAAPGDLEYPENPGTQNILLTRSGGDLVQAVTVSVTTSGTATTGSDYQLPTTLTFAPNQTTATLPLTILQDTAAEDVETIVLSIKNASGATLAEKTVRISKNDWTFEFQLKANPASPSVTLTNTAKTGLASFIIKPILLPRATSLTYRATTVFADDSTSAMTSTVNLATGAGETTLSVQVAAITSVISTKWPKQVKIELVSISEAGAIGVNFQGNPLLITVNHP